MYKYLGTTTIATTIMYVCMGHLVQSWKQQRHEGSNVRGLLHQATHDVDYFGGFPAKRKCSGVVAITNDLHTLISMHSSNTFVKYMECICIDYKPINTKCIYFIIYTHTYVQRMSTFSSPTICSWATFLTAARWEPTRERPHWPRRWSPADSPVMFIYSCVGLPHSHTGMC